MSAVLREAKVPLVSSQDCKTNYGSASITNNMLCAGILGTGVDACQGDSGGNGFRINNRKRLNDRSEANKRQPELKCTIGEFCFDVVQLY